MSLQRALQRSSETIVAAAKTLITAASAGALVSLITWLLGAGLESDPPREQLNRRSYSPHLVAATSPGGAVMYAAPS